MSTYLADQLRKAIDDSKFSLNELEKRTGVSRAIVSRFMRGERTLTLPVASKLCEALGMRLVQTQAKPKNAPKKEGKK